MSGGMSSSESQQERKTSLPCRTSRSSPQTAGNHPCIEPKRFVIPLPIGCITLEIVGDRITQLVLPHEEPPCLNSSAPTLENHPLAQEATAQLNAYFTGKLKQFSLPLQPYTGTPLQQAIHQALLAIPYAHTVAYSELGPPRTAARVCSQNPLPILIPCHRVLPVRGSIAHPGQYRGGSSLKRFLLQLETRYA